MSYDAAAAEIRGRLKAQWADRIPVEKPNVTFKPPNPPSQWMRLTIQENDARRLSIGASTNNYRHPGIITLQLFDALGAGDGPLLRRAQEAADIFQSWSGVSVVCQTATVKTIGNDDKGWYQINVIIPFYWDDLK